MTWENITLKQYLGIQKIYSQQLAEFDQAKELLAIVCNKDINHLPIKDLDAHLQQVVALLNTPIPQGKIHKEYTINGHKYTLKSKIEDLTTAQFWDFTEYSKQATQNLPKIMACFLVPAGKEYGEGYDIDVVLEDMLQLPIVDVNTIAFFLLERFRKLQQTIMVYSMLATNSSWKPMAILKLCKRILKACKSMDCLTLY